MKFNFRDNQPQELFHDKAFRRSALAPWDERWEALSKPARRAFLDEVKVGAQRNTSPPARVLADIFVSTTLAELKNAGFVRAEPGFVPPSIVLADDAFDFAVRIRALARYQMLRHPAPTELSAYFSYCFSAYDTSQVLQRILEKGGVPPGRPGEIHSVYVPKRRWPDWVANFLGDPLARPLLEALEAVGGKMRLAEIHTLLPGRDRDSVRGTVDRLINHLVLFEDLGPNTLDVFVGLLPAVVADREKAKQTPPRPPLDKSAAPTAVGPEGGTAIPDLRALLLELASGRARLKMDRSLYQKESDRFLAVLDPLPDAYVQAFQVMSEKRLSHALRWANVLRMVTERVEGEAIHLELTDAGRQWLALGLEQQYAFVFDFLRNSGNGTVHERGDELFLSSDVTALRDAGPLQSRALYWAGPLTAEQRQPLRDVLYAALRELPIGTFVSLPSFLAHANHGPHNPVLLGRAPEQVAVRLGGRLLPPLEENLEDAGRQVLRNLVEGRLLDLGCVRLGLVAPGRPTLIARLPRLDAYFGQAAEQVGPSEADVTRVVVQPDFSVIIIGLSPAPVADLAPFCERKRGSVAQGSVIYQLTREAVVRAIAAGLSGKEVMARLERHASTPLPRNVAREVSEWCEWVRTVPAEPVTMLRCPDSGTADRVQAALGRKAERANETIVLFPEAKLTSAERQKLLGQGVLLDGAGAEAKKGGKKKKK